ncbi:MAG: universal stress protein [Proteobacteria bacterium]|nr:universal stress protein [Pseudomonadota bacterium]
MAIRKLLIATDFSPGAEPAFVVACRLAIQHDAELVLAHVWDPPNVVSIGEFSIAPEALDELAQHERVGLSNQIATARTRGVKIVSSRFVTGVPWSSIVDLATEDHAFDLVVVGTQGRSAVARFLLGSVAEKVIRHAPCSVLAVRGDREHGAYDHVACATDFSDQARVAVDGALELATTTARLELVHAIELPIMYGEAPISFDTIGLETIATRELESWAASLRERSAGPVTVRKPLGSAAQTTLDLLEADRSIDLAVVGSHGRTGLRRVFLGSVAERIVRHSPCSVLVARKRPVV